WCSRENREMRRQSVRSLRGSKQQLAWHALLAEAIASPFPIRLPIDRAQRSRGHLARSGVNGDTARPGRMLELHMTARAFASDHPPFALQSGDYIPRFV